MSVWAWKLGCFHYCKKDYDVIIGHTHVFGRLWWRETEQAKEAKRQREIDQQEDEWWDIQVRDALNESEEICAFLAELAFHEQPTEMEMPMGLPTCAMKSDETAVIRPRAI